MTPETLLRFGAAAAVLGGGLRIAAAFIPYTPQAMPLEAFYATIDVALLLGLTAIYVQAAETLGWPGLAAFAVSFVGLASIVGPDATMFGVDWYQAGAAVAALGLAALGLAMLVKGRMMIASLCWIATPLIAAFAPSHIAPQAAGIVFGLGFVAAGAALSPALRG